MSAPIDVPIPLEEHADWRADDITDTSRWTLELDSADIDELRAALEQAHSAHGDVLDVTAADFALPTLAPRIAALEQELINGRGFARITGIPVDDLGYDAASWMYWGIGMHLGAPWPQNVKGHLLGDVRDQGKRPDDPTARGNELGGVGQPFHSDGSDLVGLMCLNAGVSGGESLIANALGAHNELVRTAPELAAALYEPLPYDFRGEEAKDQQPFYFVPAFTRHGDRLFVRYIRPYIMSSQRHPESPRLSEVQLHAMDAFDALINDPQYQVEMTFAPGDAQFINNYHVLHGRRPYVDDASSGQVRFLKRLWLATDALGSSDRPALFQRSGNADHWGKRRTKAS